MENEISQPPIPPAPPVQTENKNPPVQAEPPPATTNVIEGKRTEREIELERINTELSGKLTTTEREKLEREKRIMELERDNQLLREIPKPKKEKRKPNWSDPVFDSADEIEE